MGQVIQSPVEERVGCVGDDNNHTPGTSDFAGPSPFACRVHRQRKRRAVPGLRRGAGEAPAPAHPARGGRAPHRSRLARLSRLSRSRTCRFTLR
ncbi:hypothetical protein MSG28_008740 [Choristoneura fumiferana]|uniref:Uncharacterized protein n=1 Tax=Choristoneura fumiferana TaxID=7141 RepID=A0ACC0J7U4_CHOFU|nr:hypothetical protein MSG28_008740 [Choristoneura fumiferana]